jgi:hypothetical protein
VVVVNGETDVLRGLLTNIAASPLMVKHLLVLGLGEVVRSTKVLVPPGHLLSA